MTKRADGGGNSVQKIRRKNISEPLTKSPKEKEEADLDGQVDSDAVAALKADSHDSAE